MKSILFNTAAQLQFDKILYTILKRKSLITILSLHRISEDEDYFWQPMYPETFQKLIDYCRKNYEIISLSEFANIKQKASKPYLVFSFDDGYKDFMHYALPVFEKYELPSNQNIVINCVENNETIWTQKVNQIFNVLRQNNFDGKVELGGMNVEFLGNKTNWQMVYLTVFKYLLQQELLVRNKVLLKFQEVAQVSYNQIEMMDWEDVKVCLNSKVDIGSHTISHESLPTIKQTDILNYELRESKRIIENKINQACTILALPNGQYNEKVIETAKVVGYKQILLVTDKFYSWQNRHDSEPRLIDRINLVAESFGATKLRMLLFHKMAKFKL